MAKQYRAHEVASCFPQVPEESEIFEKLVADIKENGLLSPIELYDDQILDGITRKRACTVAGVEPTFKDVTESLRANNTHLGSYVLGKNSLRRHLSQSERVKIAAALAATKYYHRKVAESQIKSGDGTPFWGKSDEKSPDGGEHQKESVKIASEAFQVSSRAVERRLRVQEKGTKALNNALDTGEISLAVADKFAGKSGKEQARELVNLRNRNITKARQKARPKVKKPNKAAIKKEVRGHWGKVVRGLEDLAIFQDLRLHCRAISEAIK